MINTGGMGFTPTAYEQQLQQSLVNPTVDPFSELLAEKKRREERAKALRGGATQFQNIAMAPISAPTAGTNTGRINVSGRSMEQVNPEYANWWEPAAKMGAAALGRKAEDKAVSAEQEVTDIANQATTQALGNDPEVQRLRQLADLGVPGADKALAKKLEGPKQQSMGAFLQALTQGLDPAMARTVAPQFGLSPDEAEAAATRQMTLLREEEQRKFAQEKALREIGIQPRAPTDLEQYLSNPEAYAKMKAAAAAGRAPGKRDLQAEYLDAIQRGDTATAAQLKEAINVGKKDATGGEIPAGVRGQQTKEMITLGKAREGLGNILSEDTRAQVDEIVNNDKLWEGAGGLANKVLYSLAGGGTGGSRDPNILQELVAPAANFMLPEQARILESVFMDPALAKMAMLGGSDSNEELRRITSSLPNIMNNQAGAKQLWRNLDRWNKVTERAITLRMKALKTPENMDELNMALAPDTSWYRMAEAEMLKNGEISKYEPVLTSKTSAAPAGGGAASDLSAYDLDGLTPEQFMTLSPEDREAFRK